MCPASTVREVKSLVILMLASMLCPNSKGRDHTAVVNTDVGIWKLCEDRALNMVRRINKWPLRVIMSLVLIQPFKVITKKSSDVGGATRNVSSPGNHLTTMVASGVTMARAGIINHDHLLIIFYNQHSFAHSLMCLLSSPCRLAGVKE